MGEARIENRKSIKELITRAKRLAQAKGRGKDAEDFAQWYAIKLIEGKSQHQLLDHAFIDFLREQYGSTRNGRIGRELLGTNDDATILIERRWQATEKSVLAGIGGAESGDHGYARSLRELVNIEIVLRGRRLEAWQLFLDGYTLREIGDRFGVTESRISLLLKDCVGRVKKYLKRIDQNGPQPAMDGTFNKRCKMSLADLSKSERDVYNLAITGISNKEIGERLFITEQTVKFHATNIYKKLGFTTRSQLIAQAGMAIEAKNTIKEENEMADWQPAKEVLPQARAVAPVSQAQQTQLQTQSAQEQVSFVLNAFRVNEAIDNLQTMSREVTKGDYSVDKVMAACQCIGRMNETINTVMKAAQALRNR